MSDDKAMIDMLERDNADLRAQLDKALFQAARALECYALHDAEVATERAEAAEARERALRARVARLEGALLDAEHVSMPGMTFARCPWCRSPQDLSQPHEDGCMWAAVMREEPQKSTAP